VATRSNHESLGHLGAGIGFVAWAVISLPLLLARGDVEGALLTALPCVLVSVGLWLFVTAAAVLLQALLGRGSTQYWLVLCGGVATAVAALLLLAEHWLLPVLQAHAGIARVMHATGSVMRVPWLLRLLLLAAGPVLLLRPCVQLLRDTSAVPVSRAVSGVLLSLGLTNLLLAASRGGGAGLVDAGLPTMLLAVAFALLWSLVFASALRLQTAPRRLGAGAAVVVFGVMWCVTDHVALPYLLTDAAAQRAALAHYLTVATVVQMVVLAIGCRLLAVPVFAAIRDHTVAART